MRWVVHVRICRIETQTRLAERSGHRQELGRHSLPLSPYPAHVTESEAGSRTWSGALRAVVAVAFFALGLLWWGSEDYLKASLQFAMAAAFLMFALEGLIWPETRRPIWANAILGAVLAYFLIGVGVLIAT
jgi:hypothetical protein